MYSVRYVYKPNMKIHTFQFHDKDDFIHYQELLLNNSDILNYTATYKFEKENE